VKPIWILVLGLPLVCLSPSDAHACVEKPDEIRRAIEAEDFASAERRAREDVAASPDLPAARMVLADVYVAWAEHLSSGETGAPELDPEKSALARDVLEEIIARWPELRKPPRCLLELTLLRGEYDAFASQLDRILSRSQPPDPELMESLQTVLHFLVAHGPHALAQHVCERVVSRPDLTVPALSNCGYSAVKSEALPLARERFATALSRAPDDAVVAYNLSSAQIWLGELEEAERTLLRLSKLQPDNLDVALRSAVVCTARDLEPCIPRWQTLLEREDTRHLQIHPEDAKELTRRVLGALRGAGLDASDQVELARSFMHSDPTLAVALLLGAAQHHPLDPSYPYLLGQAFENLELPHRAFEHLRRASEHHDHPEAVLEISRFAIELELGRVALRVRRYADAALHLERARSENPELPNLAYMLGRSYHGLGARALADDAYARCLVSQNDAKYHEWCARNRASLAELPAELDPPSDSVELVLPRARQNEESPQGRAYLAPANTALLPRLREAIRLCVPETMPEGTEHRQLLLRIDAIGRVREVLQGDGDNLRQLDAARSPSGTRVEAYLPWEPACFASWLGNLKLPAPPEPDWWLVYDVEIRP